MTSLTTIAAVRADAASSRRRGRADGLRQGSPDLSLLVGGRRRRRRRDLLSQAAAGADDGDAEAVRQDDVQGAVSVGDRDLHCPACAPLSAVTPLPKRAADSLSASTTGIGLPLRNWTMAPPAVQT